MGADHRRHPLAAGRLDHRLELGLGVGAEAVDADHHRHAVAFHVLEMADEVGRACFHRGDVLAAEVVLGDAAMHLQRPHRRHHHRGVGPEPRHPALDVEEFLAAEVGSEPGLGDDEVAELQPGPRRHHRVAAMGDVGEGPAMDEGGVALDGLDEVRRQRLLEQHRHRAVGVEVARR